ncbi:hypothetical protein E0Z10_g6938 [Xylaria hypoxylon]|uniref:DNA polymerase zeta catalytic subunit n=1 Tax=Xylaria hypoxylon TaxID=37992 RepID=A0A4Z0YQZ0_9PEZI|nr:hypothetical protein E0Z10_g6938 [Xylaria hypoxylon]
MDIFRVRLNCIDHYQATLTKYDPSLRNDVRPSQLHKEPKVPVVRVFGSTETGQKVCAHIHGAFPYLFIEYQGSLNPDDVNAYIYRLHLSIDHALAVSYRRNVYEGNCKYVARITLVKGVPFYGFYVGYRFFLKIYMLNPVVMTRVAELLRQGAIMKQKLQPYEAHLQYLLQFMTDYNLYGCAYIDAKRVCFRAPVPQHEADKNSTHLWHSQSITRPFITDDLNLPRVSHCSIEVDICVHDILNRHDITERQLHHDFNERNHPLHADTKLVHSMAGLWKDETARRKRRMPVPTEGSSPFPPEALVSMSADPRHSQPSGWIHEEEYRDQIQQLVWQERERNDSTEMTFDTFVQSNPFESLVKTALQSVEDLYPNNLESRLGATQPPEVDGNPASSIVVDEDRILDMEPNEDDVFPDDSDEDAIRASNALMEVSALKSEPQLISPSHALRTLGTAAKTFETPRVGGLDPLEHLESHPLNDTLNLGSNSSPLPEGIHASCLRTSHRLKPPISSVLLDAATDHGLVSKAQGAYAIPLDLVLSKRHAPSALQPTNTKRRRVEFAPLVRAGSSISKESQEPNERIIVDVLEDTRLSHPSQVSKGKAKPEVSNQSGLPRLNFPVVKDPNDPSTKLRLSQTSSQRSDDSPVKKHVSFDVSTLTTRPSATANSQTSTSESSDSSTTASKPIKPLTISDIGCATRSKAGFFVFHQNPPPVAAVSSTMQLYNRPDVIYQGPYYSKEKDVPTRAREYAGREFRLEGNTLPFLPDFDPTGESLANFGVKSETLFESRGDAETYRKQRLECSLRSWEIAQPPPSFVEVEKWSQSRLQNATDRSLKPVMQAMDPESKPYLSQIDGATPKNKYGFKYSQKTKSTSVQHEAQYMSTMSLEIHVNTRGKLVPNPEKDEVQAIFWCSKSDENFATGDNASLAVQSGVIVLSEDGSLARSMQRFTATEITEESSELDLMVRMVEIVRTHDPDILTGYEVHGSSWGFLIERARIKYDYNLCDEFSRMKSQSFGRIGKEADKWGFNTTSTIRVTGRHMINIWRSMRGELNLLQYTMENVVWHLLHRRIPHYSWSTLTNWYIGDKTRDLSKLLRYYLTRTKLDIEILEANELIPRTSEQARVLGVDFFSVFSRGSQFKVESIMFRIAKPENFILISPDRKQVGMQNALECLPLVMEPQSAFYNSPLIVLDFQSLYPSVMIAYNYCYSTFLGRIVNWRGTNKMGFSEYRRQTRLLELLKDYINIAPNGIMYCKAEIRKSLLAKMLTEILETRVMVKSGMKQDKDDKTLQRLLTNRQLALKLLANVTYGYTSASFSGRMPCSEIADSIVQTGRETLERAIATIHSIDKWKAEVVYGDTDSLFIYLPGRTKDQAFDIGNEIAKTITDMNPRPIKLKFEKVYHPCLLLAKKRYVGYKYESKDQIKPEFDAKGIETVRRDGTPAEQMIEEKALKILFETADLSQVKAYFQRQCTKIMRGGVSIQDFCFAREVKLGTYSDRGPPPPGALISTKKMLEDARAEPQYGERVPYVVTSGAPGARLIDRCVAPEELLGNSHLSLDSEYYISKNLIPPLERIFNLVGANVRQWYDEMPKVQRIHRVDPASGKLLAKKTLESYMKAAACLVCGTKTKNEGSVCTRCQANVPASLSKLQTQLNQEERKLLDVNQICQSCASLAPLDEVPCDSKDCPVFYTRMKQTARYRAERGTIQPAIQQLLDGGSIIFRYALLAILPGAMGSWTAFLLTYLLGGVTFIPLVIVTILLHAHLTFPVHDDSSSVRASDADSIVQPGDDASDVESAQKEEERQKLLADSDVAAGYFAVCREYTPMGINAKPIERSTPVGSTTVAAPSPSVYQTMYRSIFDRKQASSPLDDNKNISQRPKRAGNVFYVVLRHGHLMLFDDDEQLEVRHVISLANHNVSIYSGGDRTPEGELFIKRNAICLARRIDGKESVPDSQVSKPFYLFSENCSAKEDFYFALLRNQEQTFAAQNIAPKPQRFDVKNIISLVQKLHASEDHTQTRWLNAFIGRIFLGIHQTKDIESLIREKLTKKISRVKRPSFLTRVAIQGISTGDSAPYITNPRLKDLNVEGEFVMEADLKYTGNFRLEVAATARIDLGPRFKAREVNLVLAVVLRKLEGHILFKVKPPPSNRIWFCFQSTPKMEMTIEPIVSSRQITYTVILRQIENRIKEVVAETLVSPFWDDTPFFSTEHKKWRGGIFDGDDEVIHAPEHAAIAAQLGNVDEVSRLEQEAPQASPELPPFEKSHSMPVVENNQPTGFWARKLNKSSHISTNQLNSASTTALDAKHPSSNYPDVPRPIRTGSFSTPSPVIGTEATHAEVFKPAASPRNHEDAASTMASISARSRFRTHSPTQTPVGSPSKSSSIIPTGSSSSNSSAETIPEPANAECAPKGSARRHTASSSESVISNDQPPDSPSLSSRNSIKSGTGSIGRGFFARKEPSSPRLFDGTPDTKNKTLTAVSNAAATAKRWGWGAIQRQAERSANGRKLSDPPVDLNQPMGRGQPLPPPGTPLPRPGEIAVPKRKPMAPPPQLTPKSSTDFNEQKTERRHILPPPVPRRRRVSEIHATQNTEEHLLVVEAPTDSEPNSPSFDTAKYPEPWVEDVEEEEEEDEEEVEQLDGNKPELVVDGSPPSTASLAEWSEPNQPRPLEVEKGASVIAHNEESEDYSSWIDNPEFKEAVPSTLRPNNDR